MKKIFWIVFLTINQVLLIIAPIGLCNEDLENSDYIEKHLSKIIHQMIVEILIEDREYMRYPLDCEKEIRNTLNSIFNGEEVKNTKKIKLKILEAYDSLNCTYMEEIWGYVEYTKKATLYYITLGLLSGYHGSVTYLWDIADHSLYYNIDDKTGIDWYREGYDSYLTLKITKLYVLSCFHGFTIKHINSYLIDCSNYFQYIPKKERFQKYIKQLEHLVKECTKEDYQIKSGDSYWSLARYIREKSDLPRKYLNDDTLLSKLAQGIEKDLQSKGINRLEAGEKIELYDLGYYISILIDEESL